MDKNGIVDSVEELAKHVRKSPRTIFRWMAAGMPQMADGRFDLLAVTEWRRMKKGSMPAIARRSQDADEHHYLQEAQPPVAENKDYWDAISKKEQALKRRLDRVSREGELMERKAHEDATIIRILEIKALLLSYERMLPPELIRCKTDREMSEVIRKFTRKILRRFARPFTELTGTRNATPGS